MEYSKENNSQAEIGQNLADFISKFVSPPTIAIVATISFSLWSPIGLGSLYPPLSILLCFSLFAFLPFLPVIYYYRKKVVDLYVSKKETRTPFFLIAIALYSIAAIIFFATDTKIMFLLALGYTFVTIILLVVNNFWKVSVHSAGVTGPIFALIFVFGVMVLPLSLVILLVSWSRIKLKMHTFRQTLVGTLIPIAVGLVIYPILYPLI
jgi:membrane-associated phospholipid phosphatase